MVLPQFQGTLLAATELVVLVTSSRPTEATVAATVTIPAGASSAGFAIQAVDDTLLDGTQLVAITAP